jgi:mycothiol system anti-sigma-R factor
MNCTECAERVYLYLDRELSDAELAEVDVHLLDCPPCVDHFSFEGRVLRLVGEKAREECCPDDVRGRIAERLAAARGGRL